MKIFSKIINGLLVIAMMYSAFGFATPSSAWAKSPAHQAAHQAAQGGSPHQDKGWWFWNWSPRPPSIQFHAVPASIKAGHRAVLFWWVSGADSVEIDNGIGRVGKLGWKAVRPQETIVFTLTARGKGGISRAKARVQVKNDKPDAIISVSPSAIQQGESAQLSWETSKARTVSIDPGIGIVPPVGSLDVSPSETTTYTLTAVGRHGAISAQTTLAVYARPTVSISASPSEITAGESIYLNWSATNAESVTIDNGIGEVSNEGSLEVSPTETTSYTVTATGPGGSASDSVEVIVNQAAGPIVEFSGPNMPIELGQSAVLTWSTQNANAVLIDGIGVSGLEGSVEVTPEATTTYVLFAFGSDGNTRAETTVLVSVVPSPQPSGTFGAYYEDLIPGDTTKATYDSERFAIITGMVVDEAGSPLSGVTVKLPSFPEYGSVETDTDGRFAIPVEGGGYLTLAYAKEGFISAQRTMATRWNDVAVAPDVALVIQDEVATKFIFNGDASDVAVHTSSTVSDSFGTRSLSLVMTGDNKAYAVASNGTLMHEISAVSVRSTEYKTLGAMPAELPTHSAYTYCSELSVDGIDQVSFDKPVIGWVDNFLDLGVGMVVPVGYYDRAKEAWVPSENGIVVRLLDTDSDNVVDAVDSDGDNMPDDLDGDNSTADEAQGLTDAQRFLPGKTFWRYAMKHFTPYDLNFPLATASEDAVNPNAEAMASSGKVAGLDPEAVCMNSYCTPRDQVFHEDISIPGTDITLHYASDRTSGYKTKIVVPASGDTVPASLKRIVVQVRVAGRLLEEELPAKANQTVEIRWDGLDWRGQPAKVSEAGVSIGFVYDGFYSTPASGEFSFGQPGTNATNAAARVEVTRWKEQRVAVSSKRNDIADGWTLSNQHYLNPKQPTRLQLGNGMIATTETTDVVHTVDTYTKPTGLAIDYEGNVYVADCSANYVYKILHNGTKVGAIAGTGSKGYSGDGGPATQAQLNYPFGVGFDSKGNIYIADSSNHRIRKVDTNGIITTVVGTGVPGYNGDGIPATSAQIKEPNDVVFDKAGNMYITDRDNHRIRKVDPGGIITTFAGTGVDGANGDGGPATLAQVDYPTYMAIDNDGNLYFTEQGFNSNVRKIDTNGIITSIAGAGSDASDDIPATESHMVHPFGIAVDDAGYVYVADKHSHRVRVIDPSGMIRTIFGTGTYGTPSSNYPADKTSVTYPNGLGVDQKGDIFVTGYGNLKLYKIALPEALQAFVEYGEVPLQAEDGKVYVMAADGRHMKTMERKTATVLYEYEYDANGKLVSVTDRFGDALNIERDADGRARAVVSPDGLRTELDVNDAAQLVEITRPDNSAYKFEYTDSGLMTAEIDPRDNRFEHVFDSEGRMTESRDPEAGFWLFENEVAGGTSVTTITTAEGVVNTVETLANSTAIKSVTTAADGSRTVEIKSKEEGSSTRVGPCGTKVTTTNTFDRTYIKYLPSQKTITLPSGQTGTTYYTRYFNDRTGDGHPDYLESIRVDSSLFRLTVITDVIRGTREITDGMGKTITEYYDPETLLTRNVTTPGLAGTFFEYDERGRIIGLSVGARRVAYAYDVDGNVESVTDARDRTTSYEYDAVGRRTAVYRPDGSGIRFSYDLNGNMLALTTPSVVNHDFEFNSVNKKTGYRTPLSGSYGYEYDKDRRLTRVALPSGKAVSYTYEQGRLTHVQTPEGGIDYTYGCGGQVEAIAMNSELLGYTYDGPLMTAETYSGTLNQAVSVVYDNMYEPSKVSYAGLNVDYTYNSAHQVTKAGVYEFRYSALHHMVYRIYSSSLDLRPSFNQYGELRAWTSKVNGQAASAYRLVRDSVGRITARNETIGGVTHEYEYGYDALDRLTTVVRDGEVVEEYAYDGAHNARTGDTNTLRGITGRVFAYDDEDHLESAGEVGFQYDADGFLTYKGRVGNATQFSYGSRGELLRVDLPDGTVVEYVHDPLGRRIAKKIDAAIVEKYLWQGLTRLLAVYNGEDGLKWRFEYAGGRMPLAMTDGSGNRYHLAYDQAGTLRAVFDANGAPVKVIEYDTFGNVITDTAPDFEVPFGFAGGLFDRDTGLVRFGHRDYDPDTGRWTAKDPIGFAGGDTDLYGYVLGDPVNAIDPDGLVALSLIKKALRKVHKHIGGPLKKGKPGKFGSPQRGTPQKGYRLDPPHPCAKPDSPEAHPHINWWDYTKGKRGKGGKSGVEPIIGSILGVVGSLLDPFDSIAGELADPEYDMITREEISMYYIDSNRYTPSPTSR